MHMCGLRRLHSTTLTWCVPTYMMTHHGRVRGGRAPVVLEAGTPAHGAIAAYTRSAWAARVLLCASLQFN
jgi:hypothetical protein